MQRYAVQQEDDETLSGSLKSLDSRRQKMNFNLSPNNLSPATPPYSTNQSKILMPKPRQYRTPFYDSICNESQQKKSTPNQADLSSSTNSSEYTPIYTKLASSTITPPLASNETSLTGNIGKSHIGRKLLVEDYTDSDRDNSATPGAFEDNKNNKYSQSRNSDELIFAMEEDYLEEHTAPTLQGLKKLNLT